MTDLVLTLWDDTADGHRGDNIAQRGPFDTLQAALDDVEAAEVAWGIRELPVPPGSYRAHQCVLLTGTDEEGGTWDAFEPKAGDQADTLRAEYKDATDAYAEAEARTMAGMAHGNRGLADFDGLGEPEECLGHACHGCAVCDPDGER